MASSKPLTIALTDIDMSDRILPLREAKAREIALSMAVHDLVYQPIGLRHVPRGTKKWKLVFGRHRARAFEINGLVELVEGQHFKVLPVSANESVLVEIEENMARENHTPFARAVMLSVYRQASVDDGLVVGGNRGGDRKSAEYRAKLREGLNTLQSGFTAHAMEVFDLSADQAERLLRIGSALTRPTGLADRLHFSRIARNQSQLLKLSALPEDQLERAAEAFDAAKGDFFNLMSILSRPVADQAAVLGKLKAGTAIEAVVEQPAPVPSFDHFGQAVSAFSQLDFKSRVSAVEHYWKHDERAIRSALKALGFELVRVGGKN